MKFDGTILPDHIKLEKTNRGEHVACERCGAFIHIGNTLSSKARLQKIKEFVSDHVHPEINA